MSTNKQVIEQIFQKAGIKINGHERWDIQVFDERFYQRILRQGSMGLGESYMDCWWECPALDEFFFRVLKANLDQKATRSFNTLFHAITARLFNQQTRSKSAEVATRHYDIGNDLYELMLDQYMVYSCAWWENATTLDEAQRNKLELICRKLKLEKGMRLLDIGCGWGGLARYAAEHYGVSVVGITISEQQFNVAKERCKELPVEIRLQDYRYLHESFDRIVSVGMFEHVGYKNYRTLMEIAAASLSNDGIFLLHTIGGNQSVHRSDPWINKYIFPNSMLPSIEQIAAAIQGLFIVEDWHNFGLFYDRTCMEWLQKFQAAWPDLHEHYDDTFYRMWKYYLSVSAASFRSKKNQLWQIVLTKPERALPYRSVRCIT